MYLEVDIFVITFVEKNYLHRCQGHRDGTLLFEGTVISQKLSHRILFVIDTS